MPAVGGGEFVTQYVNALDTLVEIRRGEVVEVLTLIRRLEALEKQVLWLKGILEGPPTPDGTVLRYDGWPEVES
jgi:hypothetical protein